MSEKEHMSTDKIIRVLRAHPARLRGWTWVRFLFDKVKPEDLEGEVPLGVVSDWSTYDDCVSVRLSVEDQKFVLKYTIYEGDMMYGRETCLRFTRTYKIPWHYARHFENTAQRALFDAVDEAWEKHVEEWKQKWMDAQ